MAKRGPKPKFTETNLTLLHKRIDEYFTECRDSKIPFTMTGLAIAVGFTSRKVLIENANRRDEIGNVLTKARTLVEEYAERMLYSKYSTGAQFALKNMGWRSLDDDNAGKAINELLGKLAKVLE